MGRLLLSTSAVALLLAGFGIASAQTTSTTTSTWTTDQGTVIRDYSTSRKYTPFIDPSLEPNVGVVLPGTVMVYPLPDSMKVPEPDRYSYSIINNRPVVVERSSRKVIHTWE